MASLWAVVTYNVLIHFATRNRVPFETTVRTRRWRSRSSRLRGRCSQNTPLMFLQCRRDLPALLWLRSELSQALGGHLRRLHLLQRLVLLVQHPPVWPTGFTLTSITCWYNTHQYDYWLYTDQHNLLAQHPPVWPTGCTLTSMTCWSNTRQCDLLVVHWPAWPAGTTPASMTYWFYTDQHDLNTRQYDLLVLYWPAWPAGTTPPSTTYWLYTDQPDLLVQHPLVWPTGFILTRITCWYNAPQYLLVQHPPVWPTGFTLTSMNCWCSTCMCYTHQYDLLVPPPPIWPAGTTLISTTCWSRSCLTYWHYTSSMTCWWHQPTGVTLTGLPSWHLTCQYSPLAYCTELPDPTDFAQCAVYTNTCLVPTCASLVSSSGPTCRTHQPASTCPYRRPAASPCSRYVGPVFLPDPLALSGLGVPSSAGRRSPLRLCWRFPCNASPFSFLALF